MSRSLREDPWGGFSFQLELSGAGLRPRSVLDVLEVDGLEAEHDTIDVGGAGPDSLHARPGVLRWKPLTLRVSCGRSSPLRAWWDEFIADPYHPDRRRSGSVILLADDGEEVCRYDFFDAWPVGWRGPALNAGGSELATELWTLHHRGIRLERAR